MPARKKVQKWKKVPEGLKNNHSGTFISSGTRDQLYLGLRLASLERYMDNTGPMPFIVDDVLVDFDDKRSEAALKAVTTLADKTQVILFTHRSRVVEQAKKLSNINNITVHDL